MDVVWQAVLPLVLTILVWGAILTPPITFVRLGQERRFREIEAQFSVDGMRQYLRMFHRCEKVDEMASAAVIRVFRAKFDEHIGRRLQRLMLVLLGILVAVASAWILFTVFRPLFTERLEPLASLPPLPAVALASLCGALLWVSAENLRHWSGYKFSRVAFARANSRIIFSVPLGYAIASPFDDALAPFIALLVGLFPTSTVESWGRRFVEDRVVKTPGTKYEDGTSSLLSVDPHVAEELQAVGVNTIFELAYQDPVQISARTGLDFVSVTEHMGQALLARYLRQDMAKLRPLGLLGAQEVQNLCASLEKSGDDLVAAKAVLAEASKALAIDENALLNTLEEVAQDPFTKFLASLWLDTDEANAPTVTDDPKLGRPAVPLAPAVPQPEATQPLAAPPEPPATPSPPATSEPPAPPPP